MKASELIAKLEELKQTYGDVDVLALPGYYRTYDIINVNISQDGNGSDYIQLVIV